MATKSFPLKEISISELYNSSNKVIYEVPIYQRNYAWEKDEIDTLIQDVYDAYTTSLHKKEAPIYFIGTLVTFHKGDGVYEVIDGQQRLTTINLILHALGVKVTNKLTYKARKKSNDTIQSIPEFNIEEKDRGIENGFIFARKSIAEKVSDLEGFKKFFLDRVHIIHYIVPKDIDLNHYFEIMNSRGEQLEKHEIVKARLMEALNNEEDRSIFNAIWENCSDMGVYIQYKFKDSRIFGHNLCDLKIKDFSGLPHNNKSKEDHISIKELIENESLYSLEKPDLSDDKPDTFQPIIDFPNFLLIVLKLTLIRTHKSFDPLNFNLDDKELLKKFEEIGTLDHIFVKKFGFNLLKAKFLLDNCIVHHSNEEDSDDSNPWKLQYWQKDNKKGYLKNLCSNPDSDSDLPIQQRLLQLLSMFEVSFTPRQRKNYLFYCLLYLFDKYEGNHFDDKKLTEYVDFVETLADKYFYNVYLVKDKLNKINTPEPGSFDKSILQDNKLNLTIEKKSQADFEIIYGDGSEMSKGIPLFVFNYLDYKLWKGYYEALRSEKYKEGSKERNEFFDKLGCSDFGLDVFRYFYFSRTRRSLEHFYPQANVNDEITDNEINCLGNYAMIGSEANSSGSNWDPKTKVTHYLDDSSGKIKQISVASLKFMAMMQMCKDRSTWFFPEIKEHQNKMLDIIFNGF